MIITNRILFTNYYYFVLLGAKKFDYSRYCIDFVYQFFEFILEIIIVFERSFHNISQMKK